MDPIPDLGPWHCLLIRTGADIPAYQISYSLQSMLLTGFVLMLPAVYLLDGYYLALLYMGGICWTGWNSDYMLLALLLLPYYIKCVRKGRTCRLLSLCFFIWMLYLAILYVLWRLLRLYPCASD